MAKQQFKAESKRLLDLMVNSIYTHKEIFLRELISNASDACDKLCHRALSEDGVSRNREDYPLFLSVDKELRTLTLTDKGIGMDKEDLENNLGVIASSGSYRFKQELGEDAGDVDVIGQFGVGFYSAFMVAERITVTTRKYGSDQGYCWQSEGADGYSVSECHKAEVGTEVVLHIKDDGEEESYGEFLDEHRLQSLVRKYSDYIRYPIRMELAKTRRKEDAPADKPEYENYTEVETLNSMVPLWQRKKAEVSPEEYEKFYRDKFMDYAAPQSIITADLEGAVTYKALLFLPAAAPYDFYTKDFERGLQLYSSGVLIMDKCADLLAEHFRFIRGVVDSPDLSLNISRELLQHDRQLQVIARSLEKKIKAELEKLLRDDRAGYETFFKNFGRQLKYGVVSDYGAHKDNLQDLLLFHSSTQETQVTLAEYVSRMGEDQKFIYYATGESLAGVAKLPQTELLKQKGIEMLYFTEEIDEFLSQTLRSYQDKELRSVVNGDLELEDGDQAENEQTTEAHQATLDFVKEALGEKVKEVRISKKLVSHPVCLTSGEGLSFEMEKYFNAVQPDSKMQADRILELNASHASFVALEQAMDANPERAKQYAELFYCQALLIAGLALEDPSAYADLVCSLMQ